MVKILKPVIVILLGLALLSGCNYPSGVSPDDQGVSQVSEGLLSKAASSLSVCIIGNRPDILPFYRSNGWDISQSNWDKIIANWRTIDPAGYATEKAKCQSGSSSNVYTDSHYNASYGGSKAVDGNNTTKWCSTSSTRQHWLTYDLGSAKKVNGFSVRHAGSNGEWADFNTKSYSIYYSNSSKDGPWSSIVYFNNTSKLGVTDHILSSSVTARFFKLQIWEPSFVDNYARIYEFKILQGNVSPGGNLSVPYVLQYAGQTSQNHDCGPACVAMVVEYRQKRPAGLSNKDFMIQIRNASGAGTNTNTGFGHLKTALKHYNVSSSSITNAASPQPSAQINQMKTAIAAGRPVIALVHGASLGRGENYGDHWIVVKGFSQDGQTVYINDPDNQAARWSGWIVGGQIALPYQTFYNAVFNAAYGDYGIIIL